MRVARIWRHPVKSFVGERVSEVDIGVLGIEGDRHWAVRDHERGGIRGAKKIGELMRFTAAFHGDGSRHVLVTFPDGSVASSRDADIDERLSAALGRHVGLESLPDDGSTDHFLRGPADSNDVMAELRGIFGREEHEPLPDFSVFPPEIATFESPPGTHHDCWPLMVMTTSAMAALRAALPDSVIDDRRFRPSLVVDTGDEPGHPEFSWTGRRARIGDAIVEFLAPCPRCVMVTRPVVDGIGEDRRILRHIVADLDQNLGVYARVVAGGRVREGDPVGFEPTDAPSP